MCLPDRRESKRIIPIHPGDVYFKVYMCLPDRRESKLNSISRLCIARHDNCLSVPSRSEGIETSGAWCRHQPKYRCLHVPSRLEGMETLRVIRTECQCCFVYTCLPDRRESKSIFQEPLAFARAEFVYTCLPDRRESKHELSSARKQILFRFTRAFPIGGNRNTA